VQTILVTGGSGFVGRTLIPLLVKQGYQVRALARSAEAARAVQVLGAHPVEGDLASPESLLRAVQGANAVVHLAAHVKDWGARDEFARANIEGTQHLLEAARRASVARFVHISTEAVLLDGTPLIDADETRPIPAEPIGLYPWSKARSEQLVTEADSATLRTVVLRPRLIWGAGDTTLTPRLVEAMRSGKFAWIAGGTVLTSTCHVRNLCQAILCALDRENARGVYFVTDGAPTEVKTFLSALVRAAGVEPSGGSMPLWLGLVVARLVEGLWRLFRLSGVPPVTRTAILLMGNQMTVSDARIRRELGYTPAITREQGLLDLAQPSRPPEASHGAVSAPARP
jgi:nucleoside-diphosphate-sugar epimerase